MHILPPMETSQPPLIVALGELLWDLLPAGPRAGGAPFNFAFHCQQLGHPAIIVSRVGRDPLGDALRREVRRLGLSDAFIQEDTELPTGTVGVAVSVTGQPTYTIAEPVAWDRIAWTPELATLVSKARAVCFGTLAQRAKESQATIQRLVAECPAMTLRVCDINLRPTSDDPTVWRSTLEQGDWLKLNDDEVERLRATFDLTAEPIMALSPAQLTCVTHGADGCTIYTPDAEPLRQAGYPVQVVDTVGAGDAFTAALLTQYLEGKSLAVAARFATIYAALVAAQAGGTPTIDRTTVEQRL